MKKSEGAYVTPEQYIEVKRNLEQDKEFKSIRLWSNVAANFTPLVPVFCAQNIGVYMGNKDIYWMQVALFWWLSYLIILLFVKATKNIMNKKVEYAIMLSRGQKVKGRHEE
jgi:hypothetical protein